MDHNPWLMKMSKYRILLLHKSFSEFSHIFSGSSFIFSCLHGTYELVTCFKSIHKDRLHTDQL